MEPEPGAGLAEEPLDLASEEWQQQQSQQPQSQPQPAKKKPNRTQRLRQKKIDRIEELDKEADNEIRGLPAGVEPPSLSAEDCTAIRSRFGFLPPNMISVAARDPVSGTPLAIELYPLKRCDPEEEGGRDSRRRGYAGLVQPWPTTFWLMDEALSVRLSKLELKGWVDRLERRLNDGDEEMLRRADEVHDLYGARRWGQLTDDDRALCEERKWRSALRDVGVAGMKHSRAVKCLHAQYGFFLGTRTLPGVDGQVGKWSEVGEWIHDLLERNMDEVEEDGETS